MRDFIKTVQGIGKRISRKISGDSISVYASEATFFLLLAFFPFLTFLLTLLNYLPINYDTEFMRSLFSTIPDDVRGLLDGVISEISEKSNGAVMSVSVILFLWSAANGMLALKNGLENVYGNMDTRNYFLKRLICALYTFLMDIVIIIAMVLMVFGNTIAKFVEKMIPSFIDTTRFILSMRFLFAGILFMLFFLMLYSLLPSKKKNFFSCIPGAIICTAGWLGFSFLFGIYVSNFSNFSYMYGSLAAVVICMLWLRVLMIIFFFGAEVNYAINTPSVRLMFVAAFDRVFRRKTRYDNAKLVKKRKIKKIS